MLRNDTIRSILVVTLQNIIYNINTETLIRGVYIPVRGNRASRMPGTDIPETGNRYFYSINDLSRP